MNQQKDIAHLLSLENNDWVAVNALIAQYPYASVFYSIRAKMYQKVQHAEFSEALQQAAIRAADRNQLYELIVSSLVKPSVEKVWQDWNTYNQTDAAKNLILNSEKTTEAIEITEEKSEETSLQESKPEIAIEKVEQQKDISEVAEKHIEETPEVKQAVVTVNQEEAMRLILEKEILAAAYEITSLIGNSVPDVGVDEENSKKSFGSWLQQMKSKPKTLNETEPVINNENPLESVAIATASNLKKVDKMKLIDAFIKQENQGPIKKQEKKIATNEQISNMENALFELSEESFITETLANIYAKQGNILKAIKAYEFLQGKYPEKSTFFAARILELKTKT